MSELASQFPHEADGIRKFYDECWVVFNSLNTLELKSLEEPRYLLGEFVKHPIECLQLALRVASNTGDVAQQFIKVCFNAHSWRNSQTSIIQREKNLS